MLTPLSGSPPHIVRMRECGQLRSPRSGFRQVLNVRSVTVQKELRDRDLHHDARIKLRIMAHELSYAYDKAQRDEEPLEVQQSIENAYHNALGLLSEAHTQRRKRIARLENILATIKQEIRRVRAQPCMKLCFD